MKTTACVFYTFGSKENQTPDIRKNYELYLRKCGNVAICICKGDCTVNVIGACSGVELMLT
jgi:hypothetical protein